MGRQLCHVKVALSTSFTGQKYTKHRHESKPELVLVLPLIFRRRRGKCDALTPLAIPLQPATVKTKLSWELPDARFQRLLSWGPGALSINHLAIMSDFIG